MNIKKIKRIEIFITTFSLMLSGCKLSKTESPILPTTTTSITAKIVKQPSITPKLETKTIKKVNYIDYYVNSSTGISNTLLNSDEINEKILQYGKFIGNGGMDAQEYKKVMNNKWLDVTEYENPIYLNIDLNNSYTYNDLVNIMQKLSRFEGVYLYQIGTSTQGKPLYAIEIDRTNIENPDTLILTGNVHARETAGSCYIIKELIDLVQSNSIEVENYLSNIRIAAVACVNPDGREGVCFDVENYTYSDGQYWKATSNGTDINRNFPGLSWGQLKKGNSQATISLDNKTLNYPGDYAGSCRETQALMKFLYHYIVVEQGSTLIDYHQQGRIGYAGKPWQTKEQEQRCIDLANDIFSYMNIGNISKYHYESEKKSYGLDGSGSTLTDYATSIAVGAKYSPQYGFSVMTHEFEEYPLIMFGDLDNTNFEEVNSKFRTMTFEIGDGKQYLGYSEETRKLLNEEYYTYHYDTVLLKIMKNMLENNMNKKLDKK